jgi:hypothetical protein
LFSLVLVVVRVVSTIWVLSPVFIFGLKNACSGCD